MVSSGGMTDRLHRLEQAGLIARIDCDEDRRSRRVQLTAQGMAVIDRAFAEDMAVEHALLSALDDQQQDQLADLLAQLLTAIERTQAKTQP
jgi:DNA-binding MarR family transcriptional regulator